jgi:hypothetical protein
LAGSVTSTILRCGRARLRASKCPDNSRLTGERSSTINCSARSIVDASRASASWRGEYAYRKSTSASDSRDVSETVCVPGGSGFAEFHRTSASHATSSEGKMILAIPARRS